MNKVILVLLTIVFLLGSAEAQDRDVSKVGITAAPFLEIGVGARAIGMGGAFVANADDASALYWNPAGIAGVKNMQLMFMHTEWIADMGFNYAGISFPVGSLGTLGASITMLDYGDMTVRTVDQPEGTGEIFNALDFSAAVSYARSLTDRFSIGFNAKYIHQSIWHEAAQGFAMDFGTLFVTGLNGLRIGASLLNFGTDMRMEGKDVLVFYDIDTGSLGNNDRVPANLQTEKWPLPLTFQFGLAMDVIKSDMNLLTLAVDAVHPLDNTESLNVGAEYSFRKQFYIRAGFRDMLMRDGEQGPTFGLGFSNHFLGNSSIRLDYAYADFGRLDNAQHLSLSIAY